MNAPDRWQRVEALYHAARERDVEERAAFLDAACKGDVALRREVESLLAQSASTDGFLSEPAMPVAAPQYRRYAVAPDGARSLWLCSSPRVAPSLVTVSIDWAAH